MLDEFIHVQLCMFISYMFSMCNIYLEYALSTYLENLVSSWTSKIMQYISERHIQLTRNTLNTYFKKQVHTLNKILIT